MCELCAKKSDNRYGSMPRTEQVIREVNDLRDAVNTVSHASNEYMVQAAIMREALERIAYQHGSPNEHIDYLAGIAAEALTRTGDGE